MTAPEATGRKPNPSNAMTIRMAAVALPLAVILAPLATAIHPHKVDVMDDPAVFTEYAHNSSWITVHFAQWAAALLLFAGLLGIYYAIKPTGGLGLGLARFGAAAAVQAAAAITALQVVDGVALKWAVDAWAAAPPERKDAAFFGAEALRWTEYGFQGYANILLGLALAFYGLTIATGTSYPRWLGWLAIGSGAAWIIHGAMVPYIGLFDSTPRLAATILLSIWAFIMAFLMWRNSGRRTSEPQQIEPPIAHAAAH
jgi:hypothetical protein